MLRLKSPCESLDFRHSRSARLQAGTLDSSTCSPEDERYSVGRLVATQALKATESKDLGPLLFQGRFAILMEVLKKLFELHFHSPVERVQPLQGQLGGSGRKIIRLASEELSAIGVLYDVREENVAFLEFSRHFREHGLPVPEIYAEDLRQGAYTRGRSWGHIAL